MARPTIVTIGYGGEYPFAPLVRHLRSLAFSCIELNMMDPDWRNRLADARSQQNTVLLTSQHSGLDFIRFRNHYGFAADIINLSEAIEAIRPQRSYYVPHDLTSPIYDEEAISLREVTAALMPDDRFWYLRRFTEVHEIGWIKSVPDPEILKLPNGEAIFLPSELGAWSKQPAARFRQVFKPVLDRKMPFKMPAFPGLDAIREILISAGCVELPSDFSTTSLIEHFNTIVSMGVSSVLIEAAWLGKRGICVVDGMLPSASQISAFRSFEGVELVPPDKLAEALMTSVRKWDTKGIVERLNNLFSNRPQYSGSVHNRAVDMEKLLKILCGSH